MKRDQIQKEIRQEEEDKSRLQHDLRLLADRLAKTNESISKKILLRNSYDKTIAESQTAFAKVNCGKSFFYTIDT